MEDVYRDQGIMSFGKVPCTPVTGAYASFFDIFGDVERIGTGSSHASSSSVSTNTYDDASNVKGDEEEEEDRISSSSGDGGTGTGGSGTLAKRLSSDTRRCSKCYKQYQRDIDPQISFLQEKQAEILGALHEEVRALKSENAELKFQIHVILRNQHESFVLPENEFRGKKIPSTPEAYLGDFNANRLVRNKEKTLELELESATKMIEELKWVKLHYEQQIQAQEARIGDMERQLRYPQANNNWNTPTSPVQVTTSISSNGDTTKSANRHMKSGRQRSSSTNCHQHGIVNRRNSLQSALPDDYKKAVATLPPILGKVPQHSEVPFNVLTIHPHCMTKCEHLSGKDRSSAIIQPAKTSVDESIKNNNITDKHDHLGRQTHFYFSK